MDGSSVDKREVRITVFFPRNDRGLAHWLKFARVRLSLHCIEEMMQTGGGKRKADTWYVHPSQIPPAQFRAIELRRAGGGYSPASPDEIAAAIAHGGLLEAATEDFREMRAWVA